MKAQIDMVLVSNSALHYTWSLEVLSFSGNQRESNIGSDDCNGVDKALVDFSCRAPSNKKGFTLTNGFASQELKASSTAW